MSVPEENAGESVVNKDVESEKLSELVCQPCSDEGHQLPAAGFCVDCCEYLCRECYKSHCIPRQMKLHVLQDNSTMPRHKPQIKTTDPTINECPRHQGEIINFLCRSHNQIGCGVCFATYHKKCDNVGYVEDEYKQLEKTLNAIRRTVVRIACTTKPNVTDIESCSIRAIESIKMFRTEINTFFDKLEKDAINEVKRVRDDDRKNMTSVVTFCHAAKYEIHSWTSDLDSLHQTKQNRKLFNAMDKTKAQIKTLEDNLNRIKNDNKINQYTFNIDIKLQELMTTLKTLGNLSLVNGLTDNIEFNTKEHKERNTKKTKEDNDTGTTRIEKPNDSNPSQMQVNDKQRSTDQVRIATHIRDINISYSTYNINCHCITGSALLNDNLLIIADWDNNSVKLVDINIKQNNIIFEQQMASSPWDITKIDNNLVAVTLPYENIIQFLSVASRSLSKSREMKVNGQCCGILHSDGALIVTFKNPGHVRILSMSGTILRSLINDARGAQLFVMPQYVAVSPDKSAIYVSDYSKNTVTCVTMDGIVKAVYKDHNLKGPAGMAIDNTGSVYVCGVTSYNIHQITSECTKVQILLGQEHLISCPYSLTYCDRKDKLYVGMYSSSELKVFKIE